MNITTMHWIYVGIMFLGAIYFLWLLKDRKDVPHYEYLIAVFIPVWSGLCYTSMAFKQGIISFQGENIYFARYIDWVVTTPLLLISLSLSAMHKSKRNIPLIVSIVAADIIMILCGAIGDFSKGNLSFVWYNIGNVALIYILYVIWGPLKRVAYNNSNEVGKMYRNLAAYLSIFWVLYPMFWILGPSGFGVLGESYNVLSFVITPIFSKVGFSILDLHGLRRLNMKNQSH